MARSGYMPPVREQSSALVGAVWFATNIASTVALTALFGVLTGHILPHQIEKMREFGTENPLLKFLAAKAAGSVAGAIIGKLTSGFLPKMPSIFNENSSNPITYLLGSAEGAAKRSIFPVAALVAMSFFSGGVTLAAPAILMLWGEFTAISFGAKIIADRVATITGNAARMAGLAR